MKKLGTLIVILALVIGLFVLVNALKQMRPAKDEAMLAGKTPADFPETAEDYFKGMDNGVVLDPDQVKGRNTWMIWTGGNEAFWDWLANNSFGTFDLLKAISSYPCGADAVEGYGGSEGAEYAGGNDIDYKRSSRFAYLGLMNEPGFEQASKPDGYGLCLDQRVATPEPFDEAVYGKASGVLGLRLYPNPNFDQRAAEHWDATRFYTDPDYYSDPKLQRPYRVGMACSFCHVSHSPLNPPADPEAPEFANLSGTIGAQYFWFGRIFGVNVDKDNIVRYILDSQKPGAVDTSLVPTDYINNPRAMNAVFDLPARLKAAELWHQETSTGGALGLPEVADRGPTFGVPHILWEGADSVGVDAALTRVYINIGEYHQEWIRHINPIIGIRPQSPITVKAAQENSVYWNATQERSGNMAKYLIAASGRMPLAEAPGGAGYLAGDPARLDRGKTVFAENCARCHSSKLPDDAPKLDCGDRDYLQCWQEYWDWTKTEDFKFKMRQLVQADDFLDGNYLSTDARIPVTLLETEICSSMASNAIEGHVWDNFSSQTYKDLPAMGQVELEDPITGQAFSWQTPGGGRGYQRVPSLIAIWSTAPYLHNNEVGLFNSDPSTAGRMAAFDDGIRKLLWPETRPGTINRTPQVSFLKAATQTLPWYAQPLVDGNPVSGLLRSALGLGGLVEGSNIVVGPIPKGTPVNLISNLNVDLGDEGVGLWRMLKFLKTTKRTYQEIAREDLDEAQTTERLRALAPDLMALSVCPDFVVDRGHTFGSDLPDVDKEALIEFVKRL
ncbi:hypothetical protein [Thiocystis violacea]|uniref:hypothetical protein n=1 Tax=Thiocystis violacea TaxID=13725 RepID=UPI001908F5A5|nr:hypothetical protein [Thiocystis violacea]MBK1724584.1 hypothetical protein [Thiocystis violacea]